ncbi:hypothetical protein EMPG_16423 [Blastomyces silverae]|uniref:Uncharacterized protein n=1 Tax=Blastomyces silverae TaxID=2060906 RepID=A0A0H1B9K3_9EURO|nr:hypothetical protein EMPG_16423 [Blastomyces silverae]
MAYQDPYQQQQQQQQQPSYTNDEYVAPRAVICNELCYGCSTKRFAVALRVAVCVLTLGITEGLRGQDGWCAACLGHPVAPPPRRSPSRTTYVSQQPAQPPPMEMSIPTPNATVTAVTQPTPLQSGLSPHSARKPSYGQPFISPDPSTYSYPQQQPQPQQTQGFTENQQQPLPQFQPPSQQDQQIYSEFQQQQEIDQQQYQDDLQQQQQHQNHHSQEYSEYQQQQPLPVPHSPHSPPPQANQQTPWQQQPQQQPPIRINSPLHQQTVPQNVSSNMVPNTTHYMTPSTDPNTAPSMPSNGVPNMVPNTTHYMTPSADPNTAPSMSNGAPSMVPNMVTPNTAPNMVANNHSSNGVGGTDPYELPVANTLLATLTNTLPGRKPINIVISPQAVYTPPQLPQEVHIQPVIHIKPKVKRRDSSSSDSS